MTNMEDVMKKATGIKNGSKIEKKVYRGVWRVCGRRSEEERVTEDQSDVEEFLGVHEDEESDCDTEAPEESEVEEVEDENDVVFMGTEEFHPIIL
jgi:hypothetical protein